MPPRDARSLSTEGTTAGTTDPAQAWIFHTQIAEAIEASADYEVVRCDRFEGKRAVSPGFQHEIDGIIDDLIVAFGVTFQPP